MFVLEPLDKTHDRDNFGCGIAPLDHYLRAVARQHIEKNVSRTYVMVEEGASPPKSICGFLTLTGCQFLAEKLPPSLARKLPRGDLPAIKLARLAVAADRQGQGIGGRLMAAACVLSLRAAHAIGGIGLFVDAKDDKARTFCEHFGCVSLPDQPLTLFLPLASVRRLAG